MNNSLDVHININNELYYKNIELQITKQILMIDYIYQHINIKKALIICDSITELFLKKLNYYNHNVSTIDNINKFINNTRRLLVIDQTNFLKNTKMLSDDQYIDTIFIVNTELIINFSNYYKNIIVFNI